MNTKRKLRRSPSLAVDVFQSSDRPSLSSLKVMFLHTLQAKWSIDFFSPGFGEEHRESVDSAYRLMISKLFGQMLSDLDEVAMMVNDDEIPEAIAKIRSIQSSVYSDEFRDRYLTRFTIERKP